MIKTYTKTVLNVKTDPALKQELKKTAENMGMNVSMLVTIVMKNFLRKKEVTLRIPERPNKRLQKLLDQVDDEIKRGDDSNWSPTFDKVEDAIAYLHRQK